MKAIISNACERWVSIPRIAYPAIGALALCVGLGFLVASWDADSVRERYVRLTEAALERGDSATAMVGAARLLELPGGSREESLLLMARAQLAAGNIREANGLLEWIAPLDSPGFAPAHIFVASRILENGPDDPALLRVARRQVENALILRDDDSQALRVLGRVAVRQRSWVDARQALEKAAMSDPSAISELVPVLRVLGDQKSVEEWESRASEASPVVPEK